MAFEISIDGQRKLFKEHLDGDGNDRIIFSGAFGIGTAAHYSGNRIPCA